MVAWPALLLSTPVACVMYDLVSCEVSSGVKKLQRVFGNREPIYEQADRPRFHFRLPRASFPILVVLKQIGLASGIGRCF